LEEQWRQVSQVANIFNHPKCKLVRWEWVDVFLHIVVHLYRFGHNTASSVQVGLRLCLILYINFFKVVWAEAEPFKKQQVPSDPVIFWSGVGNYIAGGLF
jgi:hypothetical protein